MRRLGPFFIALTFVLLLNGCGSGGASDADATAAATRASSATASVALEALPAPRSIAWQAPGVTYNGLHATTTPTADQVTADLAQVKAHFNTVRTYYPQFDGTIDVDAIANTQGLKVVLGLYMFSNPAWIEGNYTQFVKPAIARGNVLAVVVGNEDPQDLATIETYLQRIKTDFPSLPVSTAQTSQFWLTDSRAQQVLPYVDFVAANIYPTFDWQAPLNDQPAIKGVAVTPAAGFATFTATYGSIAAKYRHHQVVVTETGWPTTYGTVVPPSTPTQSADGITNAKAYLNQVIAWAGQNSVNCYVYSMFDDLYGVDTSSQYNFHFGLIDWHGNAKGVLF